MSPPERSSSRRMGTTIVESKSLHRSSLQRTLPTREHWYVWPFVMVVYPAVAYFTVWSGSVAAEYRFLVWLGALTLHALAFLACQWSTDVQVWFTCARVSSVTDATCVHVVPKLHHGKSAICPIQRSPSRDKNGEARATVHFEYQKKKYFYEPERKSFRKLDYPSHRTIGEYKDALKKAAVTTSVDNATFEERQKKYGQNRFDIPLPTFRELFKEHAVAPFFVFQVFCVGLWLMDEYWYYSLFTLFMLFVFESTVVQQRLRNLTELRSMASPPYDILVRRGGKWETVKTDLLLPGDIVSLVRGKSEDITVPCDILLLDGHCIVNEAMLSGESTPMMKESVELRENSDVFHIKSTDDKQYVLFGGTKVLQHHGPAANAPLLAPDGGCLGFVLRTGFGTTQGKLVRTMVHTSEHVSANNLESLFFILFLLIFAVAAAYHVWTTGIAAGRKTSKLLLDCIIILTSVVPPELPMELSMAVNQSLIALSRLAIFCTEPFRIPFAGKVDVCCFDKTGTLTGDKLVVEGVAGLSMDTRHLQKATELPAETQLAVATCHSVVHLEEGLIGDPMEKAILEAMDWTVHKDESVCPTSAKSPYAAIIRRFPFSSALKRMSSISKVNANASFFDRKKNGEQDQIVTTRTTLPKDANRSYWVAVKGAPEVLRDMFFNLPDHYDATYKHYAMNGSRVIALGWKWMTESEMRSDAEEKHKKHQHSTPLGQNGWHKEVSREKVESDLIFAGFLVFHCPLKPDTADAITELHQSMHRIVMITGDNPLTACHVARELSIVRRPTMIVDYRDDNITWTTVDESLTVPYSPEDLHSTAPPATIQKILKQHDICVTGPAFDKLVTSPYFLSHLLPRLFVYARTSPTQKETVLALMKRAGYITMMVGDGTNDVGALKQAHIGVALLDGKPEDLVKAAKIMRERRMKEMKKKQEELYKAWGLQIPNENSEAVRRQQGTVNSMMGAMEDFDEPPMLKFGDASVAAPFTSKLGSIQSICNIVRQGRCTLVTTIQMYKILALNCLITAFSLSALYLDGIKYGDTQMTMQGFLLAGCFLFLSWGKPIERLSRQRPQPNIFNPYILLSVLGQFAIHISALWFVVTETKKLLPPDWTPPDLDDTETKFEPNLLNTSVYLISLSMQVSTFLINYQGRPFREALSENKPLYFSLTSLLAVSVLCAAQIFPSLNSTVELVDMEPAFSDLVVRCILLDFGAAYAVEWVAASLFSDHRPHRSLGLDDVEWERMDGGGKKRARVMVRSSLGEKSPILVSRPGGTRG